MSTEKLLKIKEEIEKAKSQQSEVRGKRTSTEDQMQTKFGVKTVEKAGQELKTRATKLDQAESEFEGGMAELESTHPWGE